MSVVGHEEWVVDEVTTRRTQLDLLERHGELVDDQDRYSAAVCAELLAMSAASIIRYLAAADGEPDTGAIQLRSDHAPSGTVVDHYAKARS